jgi:hypothetical protein
MASFPQYEDTRGFWNKNKKPCIPRKETCRQTDGTTRALHCHRRRFMTLVGSVSAPPPPLSHSWKLELQKGNPRMGPFVHLPPPSHSTFVEGKLEFDPKENPISSPGL